MVNFLSTQRLTYLPGSNIHIMENDLDLQRLNQLCLPHWDKRIKTFTLRPERPEYAVLMQAPPNEKWIRVLQRLRRVKCSAKIQKEFRFNGELTVCLFLDKAGRFAVYGLNLTAALQFTAAILYDQECSGRARNLEEPYVGIKEEAKFNSLIRQFRRHPYMLEMRGIFTYLFEHMLLIDYGIDQAADLKLDIGYDWPKGRREFDDLCSALIEWAQCFPFRFCYDFARCLNSLNAGRKFDFQI